MNKDCALILIEQWFLFVCFVVFCFIVGTLSYGHKEEYDIFLAQPLGPFSHMALLRLQVTL